MPIKFWRMYDDGSDGILSAELFAERCDLILPVVITTQFFLENVATYLAKSEGIVEWAVFESKTVV